jgi:hypothetical protein
MTTIDSETRYAGDIQHLRALSLDMYAERSAAPGTSVRRYPFVIHLTAEDWTISKVETKVPSLRL